MSDAAGTTEKEEYMYVVHGVIPEAMPPVAYRRIGEPELAGRKLIKCPYCRQLLTSVDRDTQVRMYKLPKGKKKKEMPGIVYSRCQSCKGDVGMLLTP